MKLPPKIYKYYLYIFLLMLVALIILQQPLVLLLLCNPLFWLFNFFYITFNSDDVFDHLKKSNPNFYNNYAPRVGKYFHYGGMYLWFITDKEINTIEDMEVRGKMFYFRDGMAINVIIFILSALLTGLTCFIIDKF